MTRIGLSRTLGALNSEWADLESRPVPTAWRLALPGRAASATLGEVLARVRGDADAVLLALLGLQRDGDRLAGRTVVQAMVPKLVLMAARDSEASFDDYLAAMWLRVATYPVERRPHRVAANLALDTLKSVKGGRPREPRTLPGIVEPDPLGDATTVLDAGVQLGAIDPLTRRTMKVVYIDGRSSRAAGVELGMSADSVRWRCSKGVRALRAVAPELSELVAG